MSIFKIKKDGMIGVEENDIALIYKYGIVFLNGEELHFSAKWIKEYVEKNDYHHLYHDDVC